MTRGTEAMFESATQWFDRTRSLMGMREERNVYYCWSCDAHRIGRECRDGSTVCPDCQHVLLEEALLRREGKASQSEVYELNAPILKAS